MPATEHACLGSQPLRWTGLAVPIVIAGLAPLAASSPLRPQASTTRASVDSWGAQSNSGSAYPSISGDGRWVAFDSLAANLVPGDTNGDWDIFVHDRQSGQTTRVSVDSAGVQANLYSVLPSISADGRHVVFWSAASNLVAGDTNGFFDVFLHDRQNGQTSRVSVSSSGAQGNAPSAGGPLSADARYIAFQSMASNLVPGDTNWRWDVFVHDRQTGLTSRVSVDSSGIQANGSSGDPSISSDGRCVAFYSEAEDLVAGDTNGVWDVFVHDRLDGRTSRVSLSVSGGQGNDDSQLPSISGDGRYVAFISDATNLVPGDIFGRRDVFVHDRQVGQTSLVSRSSAGDQGDGDSGRPSVSADGRWVAFDSMAPNLVPGDTNFTMDAFVHDLQTGETSRVSLDSSGVEGNSLSGSASISADGRYVAFGSNASNLVPGDTNSETDVFLRDRATNGAVTIYCTAKANSQNCAPGVEWTGVPSATAGSGFDVSAASVLNNKNGLVFYGLNGPAMIAFQGGTLCVQPPARRTAVQWSGGNPPPNDCSGQFHFDFNALIASGVDPSLAVGQMVNCQYWSRDPQASFGTNLTDALEFTIQP